MRALIVSDGADIIGVTVVNDDKAEQAMNALQAADPHVLYIIRSVIVDPLADVVEALVADTAEYNELEGN